MSAISGLYFKDIEENEYVQKIFDFDNFMDNTNFSFVLGTTNGYVPARVWTLLSRLLDSYERSKKNARNFLDQQVALTLFNYILEQSFAPEWEQSVGRNLFNATSPQQVAALSTNIMAIFNANVDFSNLDTLGSQFKNLNDQVFRFGRAFAGFGNTWDVGAFKVRFVDMLVRHFYPYLYYIHIQRAQTFCRDFKCKRVYNLAKFVFVYYLAASIYLLIYSKIDRTQTYMRALNVNTQMLDSRKIELVSLKDDFLTILDEENSLDKKTSSGGNTRSTIAKYYDSIKTVSDMNVKGSNFLNEKKATTEIMQTNLSSYSLYEARSYKEMKDAKTIFWVLFVLFIIIIITISYCIINKRYTLMYPVSGLTLLAIAVYGLVSAVRSNKS